jgi:RND family efflux transporter MFP subunit
MTMTQTNQIGGRSARSRLAKWALAAAIAGGTLAGVAAVPAMAQAAPQVATSEQPERGVTRPKHEPKLAFYSPGVVAKMNVEEGQAVKAGDVLAVQDDRAEEAELLQKQGDLLIADLQVKASDADLKQKQVALKRKTELYAELIAMGKSNTEIEEAQVAVEIGQIAVLYRKGEVDKAKRDVQAAELKRDLRKLTSPVNGIVAKIDVKVGEGSDLTKPAIQVVQTDAIYVEADVPVAKAKSLRLGDMLTVSYVDEKDKWMPAKVVFLTPYANAGSGTRKVRLELVNEAGREAGLAVYVQLKKADTAAAAASR